MSTTGSVPTREADAMVDEEPVPAVDSITLDAIVTGIARGIALADDQAPVATNARTQAEYTAGIGPHTESQTLDLAIAGLSGVDLWATLDREVSYPALSRSRCDLCFGRPPLWHWCIEVKMLRMMGDNGKPNDNMLMHILSPYPVHRSALTDCTKLLASGLQGRMAIVIFGYDYDTISMDPAVEAFETLARPQVGLGSRVEASFSGLRHPVHQRGRVFGWEISDAVALDA